MSSSIDPATRMGAVRLTVADLDRARSFYARAGVDRARHGGAVCMGPAGGPVLELEGRPDARAAPQPRPLPPGDPGAGPSELARALRRALEAGASFTGASDHLVSEALYLDDPEGNGIEIYRDRPRDEWSMEGELRMATLPLDVDGVVGETPAGPDGDARGTRMGHVHRCATSPRPRPSGRSRRLRADGAQLPRGALRLGWRLSPPRRAEHLGTAGAPPPPEGARGLASLEVVARRRRGRPIEERARAAGADAERDGGGLRLRDPREPGPGAGLTV